MTLVNLDKILAGANGNIESVKVYTNGSAATEHEAYTNGLFVALKGLVDGEREVKIAYPSAGTEGEILLIATPELDYDERLRKEDFVNKKGSVARAYRLAKGDVISITSDLYPTGTIKGHLLAVGANGQLEKVTSTDDKTVVFEVLEGETNRLSTRKKSIAIQVVKA